nr:HlyC/CorC family transporter [candidate division Zixibacteria bacterium]
MGNTYIEILAIVILILANGFFSLSEFAIIASRKSRLKRYAQEGRRAAARAFKIHSRPESFLATVQVGITVVGTLAGVFSGMTIVNYLTPVIASIPNSLIAGSARTLSFLIIVGIISYATVVIGELVPKYLALTNPEKIALLVSGPITLFVRIAFLPVKVLTLSARGIMRLIGVRKTAGRASITEDEINILITEGREKGVFDETEEEMIQSVFDFTDTTARQAMTPRTEIIGIEHHDPPAEILKIINSHGFSRYPVYDESLDNIVGIIYTKDLIRILQNSELIIINDIIRKPFFVPDSMKLNTLLKTMQKKRVHAAIVLDEFGGTAGMITLEDILEEIVGDIYDEFDTEQREFVIKSEKMAFASGSFRVDELNDEFGTTFPEDGPETLSGLLFQKLGHPSIKGEELVLNGIRFRVLEVKGNRLKRLSIEKLNNNSLPGS